MQDPKLGGVGAISKHSRSTSVIKGSYRRCWGGDTGPSSATTQPNDASPTYTTKTARRLVGQELQEREVLKEQAVSGALAASRESPRLMVPAARGHVVITGRRSKSVKELKVMIVFSSDLADG